MRSLSAAKQRGYFDRELARRALSSRWPPNNVVALTLLAIAKSDCGDVVFAAVLVGRGYEPLDRFLEVVLLRAQNLDDSRVIQHSMKPVGAKKVQISILQSLFLHGQVNVLLRPTALVMMFFIG